MGSNTFFSSSTSLPDANSPTLVLTHPSEAERIQTWTLTHPMWGPALSLDSYVSRESYLTTVPLARHGGITHWILTVSGLPADERPILSSCETLRKRVLYTTTTTTAKDGLKRVVKEGLAHGIGSVFTDKQFRGRGYASRMMTELAKALRGNGGWQRGTMMCVLYSDIGKAFYSKHGWGVFESGHVEFKPKAQDSGEKQGADHRDEAKGESEGKVKMIGYHELAELCCVDERLLRERLSRLANGDEDHDGELKGEKNENKKKKAVHVAIVPELDQMLWHLMREDFMTKHIFGKIPQVKGAVYGEKGNRVWAVWTRGYYGGLEKMEGNTLHILRVVIENEKGISEEQLVEGLRSIVEVARAEAAEWRSEKVQMWNPSQRLRGAIGKIGVEYEYVDRDKDSIASLMWYGDEATEEVDWVCNEKYAWC
ncbi:lysine acetyltransferase [Cladorrhinum samala]|uniref:Lysine acetyltransferase n=1 Tax=Cladorrhinum samala TaxID=585594 RepID=A0AAV9HJL4_9PEZI|nr:lysine acetyltransferase [Cladorrhinum samala]